MLALLLASLCALETPAAAPAAPLQVLLLDLQAIDVSPDKVKLLSGRLAASMGNRGLEVLSRSDLRAMASLEADKSAVGCEEDSQSCMAEIAQALGARLVVSGQVGKLDETIILQLSLFDSQVGKAVSREEARGVSLTKLADEIPAVVDRLLTPVLGANTAAVVVAAPPETGGGISPLVIGGGAAAGVGFVAAGVLGGWALALDGTLGDAAVSGDDKAFAYENGAAIVVATGAAAVVGVAGATVLVIGLLGE